MLKTIAKSFFIVFLLSFLMLILVAKFTDSIQSNSIFAFLGYFCLTLFAIKWFESKLSSNLIVIVLLGSIFSMQTYTIYLYLVESVATLPILPIYCLGIISGFLFTKLKQPANVFPFFLCCLILVFMFFQGWNLWIHKATFGTFTGRVEGYNLPAEFEAIDEQKNFITKNNFQNKIVLLDFWHTSCGVCFQKFPQVQAAADKYKDASSVEIFAVNKPIEEDKPNQAFEMIKERGYSFHVVIAKDEDLPEKLGVKFYPTTLVINQMGRIVYKGDIEGAVSIIEELRQNNF